MKECAKGQTSFTIVTNLYNIINENWKHTTFKLFRHNIDICDTVHQLSQNSPINLTLCPPQRDTVTLTMEL